MSGSSAKRLDSLLGQTYEDFELIVSDNASTDGTADICRCYAKRDARIRYVRQPRNIGLIPNHTFVMDEAKGELFKYAAHDDLYGRDLLALCVQALDEDPDAVIAHSWTAMVDEFGQAIGTFGPGVALDSEWAPDRFRNVLFEGCHDWEYGVTRTNALPANDVVGQLPPCRPDRQCRARPLRPVPTGAGMAVLSPRTRRPTSADRA